MCLVAVLVSLLGFPEHYSGFQAAPCFVVDPAGRWYRGFVCCSMLPHTRKDIWKYLQTPDIDRGCGPQLLWSIT